MSCPDKPLLHKTTLPSIREVLGEFFQPAKRLVPSSPHGLSTMRRMDSLRGSFYAAKHPQVPLYGAGMNKMSVPHQSRHAMTSPRTPNDSNAPVSPLASSSESPSPSYSLTCSEQELYHDEGPILSDVQGGKRYPCPRCERVFRRQGHRIRHLRIHTGKRPFRCTDPGCGKTFNRMDNLTAHLYLHMREKASKAFGM